MSEAADPGIAAILRLFSDGCLHSRKQIEHALRQPSQMTNKLLNELLARRLIAQQGNAYAATYTLTPQGRVIVVFDLAAYLRRLPGVRATFTSIQPTFFSLFEGSIPKVAAARFNIARDRRAITGEQIDSVTARKELRQFMTEFIWKSSALDGNTYTFNDAKHLLTYGVPVSDRSPAETIMILNHKKALAYILSHCNDYQQLTRGKLLDLHHLLVADLNIPIGLREKAIGIADTAYTPPTAQLRHYLDVVLDRINRLKEPAEKALACLALVPYLQPFVKGNEPTSRMIANAVLIAYGYPPLSFSTAKVREYNGGLRLFYEQGALGNLRQLVLEQLEYSSTHYFVQSC